MSKMSFILEMDIAIRSSFHYKGTQEQKDIRKFIYFSFVGFLDRRILISDNSMLKKHILNRLPLFNKTYKTKIRINNDEVDSIIKIYTEVYETDTHIYAMISTRDTIYALGDEIKKSKYLQEEIEKVNKLNEGLLKSVNSYSAYLDNICIELFKNNLLHNIFKIAEEGGNVPEAVEDANKSDETNEES